MLREFYNERSYTYHLDYTVNILLYLFYHISIHPPICLSIYLNFLLHFKVNCKYQHASPEILQHSHLALLPTFIFISDLQGPIDENIKAFFF